MSFSPFGGVDLLSTEEAIRDSKAISEQCFVYLRQFDHERLLVALNFSEEPQLVRIAEPGEGQILLSTSLNRKEHVNTMALRLDGHEGCIIELNFSI